MKHLLLTTIAALLLVGCGESPNELLHQAVIDGNIEAVKQHIAAGADVNAKDENGVTPLHWTETEEIAELLIAKGADVNAKDDWSGSTPLHPTATFGYKEITELLIAKGADVNARTGSGETPLDLAIKYKNTGYVVDFLRKHGGKTSEELKAEGK